MSIREKIIQKIDEKKYGDFAVTDETDLYRDLRFDSLSFICLITEIEDLYDIRFGMTEMDACLRVGKFIELADKKSGSAAHDQKFTHRPHKLVGRRDFGRNILAPTAILRGRRLRFRKYWRKKTIRTSRYFCPTESVSLPRCSEYSWREKLLFPSMRA